MTEPYIKASLHRSDFVQQNAANYKPIDPILTCHLTVWMATARSGYG